MNSQEFVTWMKGFVEASNHYSLTPKSWETLKAKLNEVEDKKYVDKMGTAEPYATQIDSALLAMYSANTTSTVESKSQTEKKVLHD